MKLTRLLNLLVIGLLLSLVATGCRKKPTPLTVLPGSRSGSPEDAGTGNQLTGTGTENIPGGTNFSEVGIPPGPGHPGWPKNPEIFAGYTVHFDYDSSSLKAGEKSKVESVADYLKSNTADAVEVEGHCDERGTEEYNRSLGERRALAVREALVALGVDANRIDTISFGEDRPSSTSHNESAWRENRRAAFILLTPPPK
jgi:peptidoglycan-associated lipoprotein